MEYFRKLICPYCQTHFKYFSSLFLICSNNHKYHIKNKIPIFIPEKEAKSWDRYSLERYKYIKPLPPHPYYRKFSHDKHYKRMLDLGSGDGVMSVNSALHDCDEVYCVDPSLLALKTLQKRKIRNMYAVNATAKTLPFSNNFFDLIYSIFTIEHLNQKEEKEYFKQIYKVLKKSGKFVIATDTKLYDTLTRKIIHFYLHRNTLWRNDDPTHINLMYPSQLRRKLIRTNFVIIKEDIRYFIRPSIHSNVPSFLKQPFLSSMFIFICTKK